VTEAEGPFREVLDKKPSTSTGQMHSSTAMLENIIKVVRKNSINISNFELKD
jgi:hypothetical protein